MKYFTFQCGEFLRVQCRAKKGKEIQPIFACNQSYDSPRLPGILINIWAWLFKSPVQINRLHNIIINKVFNYVLSSFPRVQVIYSVAPQYCKKSLSHPIFLYILLEKLKTGAVSYWNVQTHLGIQSIRQKTEFIQDSRPLSFQYDHLYSSTAWTLLGTFLVVSCSIFI